MSGRPYDDVAAAMQVEMLEIDEEYASQWVSTMRRLVAKQLGHEEFTIQRMACLKSWEKHRKLAQARLRWKYNTGRRPTRLVERDVRQQLAKAKAVIEAARRKQAERDLKAEREAAEAARAAESVKAAHADDSAKLEPPMPTEGVQAKERPQRRRVRTLEGVGQSILDRIERETGISDLACASDDELRDFYRRAYTSEEEIQDRLDQLNGIGK